MFRSLWQTSFCAALVLILGSAAHAGDDTKSFFNGKNLDGWQGLEKFWKVEDGAIVGHTEQNVPFNTFLCSEKKYRDFELSFQVQVVDEKGRSGVQSRNSGVQIRSAIFNKEKLAVKGPQCDMGGVYWGSLYGEHFGGMMKAADPAVVQKALKKEGFNDYSIRCVGKHVTIKLNGQTTVDGDFPTLPESGIIAWQLHAGGPLTITYRNIQFRELKRE